MSNIHKALSTRHPKLFRGKVWCKICGRSQRVSASRCFAYGWPKCCGQTMTIDSPSEQEELVKELA